jgi:hypothetical protein
MTCKCVLIGNLSLILNFFREVADKSQGTINIIKRIDDIGMKDDEEIRAELERLSHVDCFIIEPFVCTSRNLINRTSLIEMIRHLFPQAHILAIAYHSSNGPKCHKRGADTFLSYQDISLREITKITSWLINPVPRPSVIFTHLRIFPKGYRIELRGRIGTAEADVMSVQMVSAPAMRQVYFLSLERFFNQADWWRLAEDHEYVCTQRAFWDMLEVAIPRKPRGRISPGEVDCDSLKAAVELVSQFREAEPNSLEMSSHNFGKRETLPRRKHSGELSQMASLVNTAVEESLPRYHCEHLIIGPSESNTSYRINEKIIANNISFDFQHQ